MYLFTFLLQRCIFYTKVSYVKVVLFLFYDTLRPIVK